MENKYIFWHSGRAFIAGVVSIFGGLAVAATAWWILGDNWISGVVVAVIVVAAAVVPFRVDRAQARRMAAATDSSAVIKFDFKKCWKIEPVRDARAFFDTVHSILPAGAVVYLEGVSTADDVRSLLAAHAGPPEAAIKGGTIWPKSDRFHCPATPDFLRKLAALAEKKASPEICNHIVIYCDGRVILDGYDAFSDPMFIASSIPEEQVASLAAQIGAQYAPFSADW